MNNKIMAIGDIHLRPQLSYSDYIENGREKEKNEILDFIIHSSKDCSKIIIGGDCFNSRSPSTILIKEFISFIERFENKKIYILEGNHDQLQNNKSTLDWLKEIKNKNWHIITNEIQIINNFTFCPYFSRQKLKTETNEEGSKKLMKQLKGGKILFAHLPISDSLTSSGMKTNIFDEVILPKSELQEKYELVIGHHIHRPQRDNNVIVTGSIFTDQVNEKEKFIWEIDEDTLKVEQIKLPCREIHGLENPDDKSLKAIKENSIVKVILTDKKLKNKIEGLKEKLKKFDAYILLEQFPNEREKVHFEEGMLEFGIEKLLEVYAKQKKVDIKKLRVAFKSIK